MTESRTDEPGVWETIRDELRRKGIDLEALCSGDPDSSRVKVICVAGGLDESLKEMGQAARDQVAMVRIDAETSKTLDAWVETGAFKSRSEAAALFIREGLKVRAAELAQLEDALRGVEQAKKKLEKKARQVLGGDSP